MAKMTILRLLLLVFAGLVLNACAPTATRETAEGPPPYEQPAKQVPHAARKPPRSIEGQARGYGGRESRSEAPSPPPVPRAVAGLLREAEASSASGRLDSAASTLERAIRIQPRSPVLWQKLAEVRLQQHQPGLAEDLAKKSNLLAKGNGDLIRKNWSIIAQARRQKGDAEGAAEADARSGR